MMRFQRKVIWQALILFVFLLALYIITILFFPYRNYTEKHKIIKVKQGMSINSIGLLLEKEGVIYSHNFFNLLVRFRSKRAVEQGKYLWNQSYSLWQVVNILEQGKVVLATVTIPEGWRMRRIFRTLARRKLNTVQEYTELASSRAFLKLLHLPPNAKNLEGFLAPDTYKFSYGESSKQILTTMVHNFFSRMPRNYADLAHKFNLSYYDAIILASIIEKETSKSKERGLISSVFHNRLRKPMPLQTDPTIIYGSPDYKGKITKKMLRKPTPYNTYRNFGLTPTPISNPGLASIMAAVQPKQTKYLYFVARGNGYHYFSETYAEHRKAIQRYQKKRSQKYRSY